MACTNDGQATTGAVDTVGADDLRAWIRTNVVGYPWAPLRGLDLVEPGIEAATTAGPVLERLRTAPDDLVIEIAVDGIAAVTMISAKEMETEHLGVETGGLFNVLCPADTPDRPFVVERLLGKSSELAAARGIEMLVLRIDVDDIETLAAAQSAGFTVHETMTTWLLDANLGQDGSTDAARLDIECHHGPIRDVVPPEFVHGLAEAAARWGLGHLCADRRIPADGVRSFYRAMIDNVVSGRWGDYLYVAKDEGQVAALSAELSDRLVLEHTGVDVRNTEWWAVLVPGRGVGKAMTHQVSRITDTGARYRSWETQVRNLPTIHCISSTGVARPIRSSYTLHRWL